VAKAAYKLGMASVSAHKGKAEAAKQEGDDGKKTEDEGKQD
jgi:hypothetical protein